MTVPLLEDLVALRRKYPKIPHDWTPSAGQKSFGDPGNTQDRVEGGRFGPAQGGTATATEERAPSTTPTPEFKSISAAQDYVSSRYGYADFTGIKDEDLPALQSVVATIDRLAAEFPQTTGALNQQGTGETQWRFGGIGTYASPGCPRAVLELGADAWGSTRNSVGGTEDRPYSGPYIWLNPDGFSEGSGLLGEIGFTFGNGVEEAAIHEFAHVVEATTPDAERAFDRALAEVYSYDHPRVSVGRDVSIYAAGNDHRETYAEVFTVLHTDGGLDRLPSAAARERVEDLQRATQEQWEGMQLHPNGVRAL